MAVLQRMGKADPMLRQVYIRHIRYRPFYPAKSGVLFSQMCADTASTMEMSSFICNAMNIEPKPAGLPICCCRYALIDDGILLQQDGSLLAGWSYRGPDMMSAAACRDGRAERAAELCAAAGIRLDGPVRRHPLARAGLSGARRVSRSCYARHR